jgi:hypothetical protein
VLLLLLAAGNQEQFPGRGKEISEQEYLSSISMDQHASNFKHEEGMWYTCMWYPGGQSLHAVCPNSS